MDEEEEMDAGYIEWLARFYAGWPWHFNARRHYCVLMLKRQIAECESEWKGEKYKARLASLERGERDEIRCMDMARCRQLIRIRKHIPDHPLVKKLQEWERQYPFGIASGTDAGSGWGLALEIQENEPVFPNYGIYIYHHPYEGYKIGQAENVVRRMSKHECSAPSLELLHVIETSDLDWCEAFLHGKFQRKRIYANHEYFDLHPFDVQWLFSIRVLDRPKNIASQLSLLDLL